MNFVIQSGKFVNLFYCLVDDDESKLIILRVVYFVVIQKIGKSKKPSIIFELDWLSAWLECNYFRERKFLIVIVEIFKKIQVLKLRIIKS